MRRIQGLLAEYGESHRNETNKLIHWICVPAIFFSLIGLLYSIKLPFYYYGHRLNIALIVLALVILYYISLSVSLAVGMLLFSLACLTICHFLSDTGLMPVWLFCAIVFVLAWVGQFYGHKIEGKKPSFLKDLQFLLIGPAWLMSFIYQKLGIKI